jgi:TusA-related sulfurtransferase
VTTTVLDERGRLCPAPIIALARAFTASPAPESVVLLADDPAADADVPAWCAMRGHVLLEVSEAADGRGRAYVVGSKADGSGSARSSSAR